MRNRLSKFEQVQTVINEYIDRNFRPGIDFGPADERNPKDTLLKPGAEKACKLFDTHPEWRRDTEIWEMAGRPTNTIFMLCRIVDNQTGVVIGEGRGAETHGNKKRDWNKSVKNAEKCAIVDAALYTFMLSERFTQDDGGRGVLALGQEKKLLLEKIGQLRAGVKSDLSDHAWVSCVSKQFLHKSKAQTIGEVRNLYKAIVDDDLYDLSTGELK